MTINEKDKIYRGAIVLFYKKSGEDLLFLVVQNRETGNITFVGGAEEEEDGGSLKITAKREVEEELGLTSDNYCLIQTETRHEFVFDEKKKERAGHEGFYHVFLAGASDCSEKIFCTEDLKSAEWMTEDEVLSELTYDDLKEVFKEAIENII